jgi:hypothetical protein
VSGLGAISFKLEASAEPIGWDCCGAVAKFIVKNARFVLQLWCNPCAAYLQLLWHSNHTVKMGHTLPVAAAEGHGRSTLTKRTSSTLRDQPPEQFDWLTPAQPTISKGRRHGAKVPLAAQAKPSIGGRPSLPREWFLIAGEAKEL